MLTSTSVDYGAAVYGTSLPPGLGLQAGMVVQDPNTNHYRMLVINGSGGSLTAAAGDALVWSAASTFTVTTSSAIQQKVVGVNDLSNAAVVASGYFWMTIQGPVAKVKTTGTPAAGILLVTTATAGTLGAVTTNVTSCDLVATAATVSGANAAWMGI